MQIHFVGIGGEGMSGLAKLALSQGYAVTGSDVVLKQSLLELKNLGAQVFQGHSVDHVRGADLVVRSSGIPQQNIEVVSAHSLNVPIIKRSEFLGRLLKETGQKVIRIAGSHGKSTTTAMMASVWQSAGLDPTVIVGAYVPAFSSHAVRGWGPYALIESCEYDSSFLDIPGASSVIIGIEPDHLDYYGSLSGVVDAFLGFAHQTDPTGIIVACADSKNIQKLFLPKCKAPIQTYGLSSGEWRAEIQHKKSFDGCNEFIVMCGGECFGSFRISFPGAHYVQNALATIAMAHFVGIAPEVIRAGLEAYKGVHRRYEKIVDRPNIKIIDDYGHTPIEISAVFSAVREEFPSGFLLCVPCLQQFHRTKHLLAEFSKVFATADACIIGPIVAGLGDTEQSVNSITSEDLAVTIRSFGGNAQSSFTPDEVVLDILNDVHLYQTPLIILIIGSGVSAKIIERITKKLK
jgi:UDP-N-acetylmuramate--alanine ligase